MSTQPDKKPPSMASQLAKVHVNVREDLEVTRHMFRGSPSYIVRDPVTFQTQRLDPPDYAVFIAINQSMPLGEIFQRLASTKKVNAADEEHFYKFILSLHQIGFLHLPINDDKRLYRRLVEKQKAKRKQRLMGLLFLRIPLWNPDAFLTRNIRWVAPLFSRTAFALWLVLVMAAGYTVFMRWGDLTEPLSGLLAAQNLAVMWLTLIVLKVIHEFGHAFACKRYGGYVPDMGAYMIMFTPCAYVDATSSWGFTRKSQRIVVCLAGMYVETICAAIAVFVWSTTGPSTVHNVAYNVIFLASVVTMLFNVNPLMRYDGYYIFSDLTEIPNLRSRSSQYLMARLKQSLLTIPAKQENLPRRLRFTLLTFGIASTLYRMTLLVAIAAVLASKLFFVGIGLATIYLMSTIVKMVRGLTQYLWHSEETAHVRRRAIAIGVVVLIIGPSLICLVPSPNRVHATGVLTTQNESIIRTETAGFIENIAIKPGDTINIGDPVATLRNDMLRESVARATANLKAAEIRRDAFRQDQPNKSMQEEAKATALARALQEAKHDLSQLNVQSHEAGMVISGMNPEHQGQYIEIGTPVATVASGGWRIRALLTDEEIANAQPTVGDTVLFRSYAKPGETHKGFIVSIDEVGSRLVELPALTQMAGGHIAVDPATHEANKPYFEIAIELSDLKRDYFRHGTTGAIIMDGPPLPIGTRVARKVIRFLQRIMHD